jgi:[ribosomal protein S18]-alanine N-acetyltransferase
MTALPTRDIKQVSLLWAVPDHARDIAGLHAAVFDTAWDAAAVARLLEHPGSTALVATTGIPKSMVGFVLGQLAADEAEVLSIGVAPEWQRHGLGARLMDGLARAAARGQAKRLFLEVAADNAGAQALYGKLGFTESGRRKAYYARQGGPAVDAIVLSKAL